MKTKGVDYSRLSKTIAHALRHEPELYGLELDSEGWADVNVLLDALKKYTQWRNITPDDLRRMDGVSGKKRFEIKEDKIRALYGHSFPSKILKEPHDPPEYLYHGTSPENTDSILKDGLKPMNRQYVHLSVDKETAITVGIRKTAKPVILIICARAASNAGINFYYGNETVWLADIIPPEFIKPGK